MSSTVETIDRLLRGALEEVDDSDVRFNLRTALQLLAVVEERDATLNELLDDTDLTDETLDRLRELGYVD